MFTSVISCSLKSTILSSFKSNTQLRVVIATIAFGMRVDCPNVRQIVDVGPPNDIGSYIQETGRAGQDGQLSMVTLLQARTYHQIDDDIKRNLSNSSQCRRSDS